MRGRGNGTLLLEINTLGKFNMYGDYQVYEGEYNFKYKGLFDKRFTVKKYSSITWEGDPMRARLNLEATYKTSANPSILLENPSVNRKVDVLVGIIITGNLASPEPDFSINFPNMNSVLRSEIESKLSDKDIRQTQALTLLSTGGFMSSDGVNQSAIVNNVVETGTGLFGDIFQSKDDKFRVNPFLETAERTPGYESNGAVGFTVSSQINDRITVNGKVGVPVGGLNQSAVVGDVEVQYRVNEDGTMNLRFFNRENDINYLGEGIGYTQGVGVTYQVDFDTFQELVKRIFGTKTVEKAPAKKQEEEEEPKVPEGMHFNTPEESRKKKETKRN
ncbi:translocation/assembly module TamB [Flavobacterium sp. N1718]|nr:translocation/assembly module TamB [Flavobacterium sp. N1718]